MLVAAEHKMVSKQAKLLAFLKGIALFDGLSDEAVEGFAAVSQLKLYKKGKPLFTEGDKANFFYVIAGGWFKLFHITEEGEELSLAMLTTDSITGENAIFEHGRYTSSAVAVEDANILCIPISFLREQLRKNSELAFNMLSSLVQYQRRHELQLERFLLYSAPQRIGCFILGLCPVREQKDGVRVNLPYDKALIASTLGMKGATFSRALNILREETGLRINGTHVVIDSMKRLLKFVDGCYSYLHLRGG